ncbi:uncharacterized protein ACMZJ9_000276 [Mantella aurantiaca]
MLEMGAAESAGRLCHDTGKNSCIMQETRAEPQGRNPEVGSNSGVNGQLDGGQEWRVPSCRNMFTRETNTVAFGPRYACTQQLTCGVDWSAVEEKGVPNNITTEAKVLLSPWVPLAVLWVVLLPKIWDLYTLFVVPSPVSSSPGIKPSDIV